MLAPGVPFDELAERHVRGLIENGMREGRRLEFKRQLLADCESGNFKLRAAISSFANSGGGDLIFGVHEDAGVAVEVTPIAGDLDAVMLRLESLAGSSIEPRLQGTRIRAIPVSEGHVVIIRTPSSWTGPHAVKMPNDAYRFYARNSSGKYLLDVDELRSAYVASASPAARARDWQAERLDRILRREMPLPLASGPVVVAHLVPLSRAQEVSPGALIETGMLQPLWFRQSHAETYWNIDGVVASPLGGEGLAGYAQLYRDGRIEATGLLAIEEDASGSNPSLAGQNIETRIVHGVANALRALQIAGAQPPFAVLLALVDANAMRIVQYVSNRLYERRPLDRSIVVLPDVIFEGFSGDFAAVLRPALDAIWQASGWIGSPAFDAEGRWASLL